MTTLTEKTDVQKARFSMQLPYKLFELIQQSWEGFCVDNQIRGWFQTDMSSEAAAYALINDKCVFNIKILTPQNNTESAVSYVGLKLKTFKMSVTDQINTAKFLKQLISDINTKIAAPESMFKDTQKQRWWINALEQLKVSVAHNWGGFFEFRSTLEDSWIVLNISNFSFVDVFNFLKEPGFTGLNYFKECSLGERSTPDSGALFVAFESDCSSFSVSCLNTRFITKNNETTVLRTFEIEDRFSGRCHTIEIEDTCAAHTTSKLFYYLSELALQSAMA